MNAHILVVEDDPAMRTMSAMALRKEGYEVTEAGSAAEARRRLGTGPFDLLLSDIYLGDSTALDLVNEVREQCPAARVILMTGYGTVETAAAAHEAGVFDYLAKPVPLDHLLDRVRSALARRAPVSDLPESGPQTMIIGVDPAIVEVYKAVARVAALPLPVLVRGETGTGKELVAQALHRFGLPPEAPFVPVNCGAIPEGLLESELFGHCRGSFTGAVRDKRGAVEAATGGTLFLDEVGELTPALQVKILRFLQDGEIRRVGSETPVHVSVRVVAATHQDLRRGTADGSFREDLFYRLAGYEIVLPPLRERPNDLPLLVDHFRRRTAERLGIPPAPGPDEAALGVLRRHSWPGNVRELENLVQRASVDLGTLADAAGLRRLIHGGRSEDETDARAAAQQPSIGADLSLEELERMHIAAVLTRCGGNRTHAAAILGIERKSLYRKVKRLGIPLDAEPREVP